MFLTLASLFFCVGHSFSYAEHQRMPTADGGSLLREVAVVFLGALSTIILLRPQRHVRFRIIGMLGWALSGFVLWAFLSALWADDLSLTLKRLVVFGVLCLASLAVARSFTFREIILWALFTTTSFLVIGIFAEFILGTFTPSAAGYRFAGTLPPNDQGIECGIIVLSGIAAANIETQRRIYFKACALLGFIFLILTRSRTSFAATLFALVVYSVAISSTRRLLLPLLGLVMALGIPLAVGGALLPDIQNATLLGRTDSQADSFNGRTNVWDDVLHYVDQRPVLGYGYGGFWTTAQTQSIVEKEQWNVPDSHSAYLDCLVTLGTVGLLFYIFILCAGIIRAFRLHYLSRNQAFAFCGATLLFCALEGTLESAVFEPSLLMFLLGVILARLGCVSHAQRLPESSHTRNEHLNFHGATTQKSAYAG